MKRLFMLIAVAFIVASCEGVQGPAGRPGQDMNWLVTEDIQINTGSWRLIANPEVGVPYYWQAVIALPGLSRDICYNGTVDAYMYFNKGPNETQTILPYTVYKESGPDRWAETIDYDFNPGEIAFYVKPSDFATNVRPPTLYFRVAMNW